MKKSLIIMFLVLLSLFVISHHKTYAWNLNDAPKSELNGLTLNEVFEVENQIINI